MFVIGNKVEYLSKWSKQIYCLVVNFRFIGWQYIQKFKHFVFTAIQLVKDLQNDDMYLIIGRHQLNAILVLHYSMLKTTKPEQDNKWIYMSTIGFIILLLYVYWAKDFPNLDRPLPKKLYASVPKRVRRVRQVQKKPIKSKPCFLLFFFTLLFTHLAFLILRKIWGIFFLSVMHI